VIYSRWICVQELEQPVGLNVPWTHSNQQDAPIMIHKSIYYKSHNDKFTIVLLHSGDEKKTEQLFYANAHSPMTGQSGTKHADDVWKHYCDSEELCTFVGLHGGNWIIMHGTENVKFIVWVIFERKKMLCFVLYTTHVVKITWWYTPKLNLPQIFNKDVQCQMPFIPVLWLWRYNIWTDVTVSPTYSHFLQRT